MAKRQRERAQPVTTHTKVSSQLVERNHLRAIFQRFCNEQITYEEAFAHLTRLADDGGNRLFQQLIRMLRTESVAMRHLVTWALIALGDRRAIEPLWQVVSDPQADSSAKLAAWAALTSLDGDVDPEDPPFVLDQRELLAAWRLQLESLVATATRARTADEVLATAREVAQLPDEALLFIIEELGRRRDVGAAQALAGLAETADAPLVRQQAARSLRKLRFVGVHPAIALDGSRDTAVFYRGYATLQREQGEVQLLLGWRRPGGEVQAAFLSIDFWNCGLAECDLTCCMDRQQFERELAPRWLGDLPCAEVSLEDARALIEEAVALNERFDQPLPPGWLDRENLFRQRLLSPDVHPPARPRSLINPDLTVEQTISYYLNAQEFADFSLMHAFWAAESDVGQMPRPDYVAQMEGAFGGSPPEHRTFRMTSIRQSETEAEVTLRSTRYVKVSGRRRLLREPLTERYLLLREPEGWRILRREERPF